MRSLGRHLGLVRTSWALTAIFTCDDDDDDDDDHGEEDDDDDDAAADDDDHDIS